MPKAVVIGAGFGGIASALRLRAKGYDVTLLDKQDKLGGRAYQYHTAAGFTHDAGPTVITAKFLFDELFQLFGKRREDYIEFRDLYPWYRIRFADGTYFNYGGTLAQMEAELEKFEPGCVPSFHKYLAHSKRIFDVGFTQLGAVPFHEPSKMFSCIPALIRLESYKTVWQLAAKYFKTEKLRRVFSFQPLLVGGNPFNTTSIYALIFYLEREWGIQFAMGGTGALVRALEKLMVEEGIQIRLNAEVERIRVCPDPRSIQDEDEKDQKLISVLKQYKSDRKKFIHTVQMPDGSLVNWLEGYRRDAVSRKHEKSVIARTPWVHEVILKSGERIFLGEETLGFCAQGVVVANADAPHVWEHLIHPRFRTRKSKFWLPRLKYSMGLFVFYFGTTRKYDDVAHHTIVLGESYKELITRIFDGHKIETKDLSVYLHRPTATDPSMAPPGCDSFYVLVPVPNLQPIWHRNSAGELHFGPPRWDILGPQMREATIDYLERTELPGLRNCITDDFYVTPQHFNDNLNSVYGAGFSIQPIFSQSAYFRFHNKAPGIENLYLCGAGTHPGAGMPGVLCSAKVVDSMIPPADEFGVIYMG